MALDIPGLAKKALNTAHNVASSISKEATLIRKQAVVYDPTTGDSTITKLEIEVRCFIFDFEFDELNENIKLNDKKVLIDKEDETFEIELRDQLVIDSINYDIKNIMEGLTENYYTLQIRKSEEPL